LLLLLCLPATLRAKDNADSIFKISYLLLPDGGYTLNDILTNNKLAFIAGDSLKKPAAPIYWCKITIANPTLATGPYYLFVNYKVHNVLYYFDANAQRWITSDVNALTVNQNILPVAGAMPLVLQAQAVNVMYMRMDVSGLQKYSGTVKPAFRLEPREKWDGHQLIILEGWIAALAVVLFFFLYNLYMYFSLRDKSTLYYLIVQFGIMIYITSYRYYFSIFFTRYVFTKRIYNQGFINSYDINNLLTHIAVVIIMYGFIQLTRNFLNTQKYLPRLNAVLKYGLYTYIAGSAVLIIINTCITYVDAYTLLYDNLFLSLLITSIIYTSVAGYRKKLRAAGAFLLANLLPLGLMTAITLFHVLFGFSGQNNLWLPTLAIVSQAFCFSVVLVARAKLVQTELKAKELEARQLMFDLQESALQRSLVEAQSQQIIMQVQHEKTKNELLQQTLEANQRELASTTLYMVQKNELLAALKTQMAELKKASRGTRQEGLPEIESLLQANLHLDDDWARFRLHFEQVHPLFFNELETKHPTLTNNEIRLYTYFHIKLSNKEIAVLLNIAHDSVRRAKSRLFKKMGITDTPDEAPDATEPVV